MVLLGRSTSTQKQTALFDIRLKGSEHDVLVIKGAPHDAPSILLSGTIVLSVLEPLSIKKLSLKLYATLRLKWTNSYETQRGTQIKKPYRYEKRVFEHNWDNFDIQNYFGNLYENYNNKSPILSLSNSANSSSSSLKSFAKKSKSSSNLASFGSSTSLNQSSNHILVQGNYEFPFSAILPGSTLESVEGLPGASLVYKLQANIERGRFSNDLIAKKHIRVVRTVTTDAVELSETMAVDNTWPKKVEYTISIPQRAVAIGSSSPIHMLFVPLCKGLKIGKVKISLVEYFSCHGSYGPPHNGDRTITELQVPEFNVESSEDKWEINTHLQIPASLTKCTQDVDILDNIKVRHKIKFVIGLINPDGHVSELRASLPVILFISPFVAVGVRNFDRKDSVVDPNGAFSDIPSDNEHEYAEDDDEVIFAPDPDFTPAMASSQTNLSDGGIERQAPPNYGNHIYDRLWNEILVEDTPEGSRAQTPVPGSPNGVSNGESISGNIGRLTENLRNLHLQRMAEQNTASLDSLASSSSNIRSGRAGFTLGGEDDEDEEDFTPMGLTAMPIATPTNNLGNQAHEQDYFSISPHQNIHSAPSSPPTGILSPNPTPGYNHISRVNSDANMLPSESSSLPSFKDWNSTDMAKVPSYQTAMKSPVFDDFAPAYVPKDDPEVTKPKTIHFKASSLNNSRAQSTARLNNLRGTDHSQSLDNLNGSSYIRSKSSSANSSPTLSRNTSSSVLNNHSSSPTNNGVFTSKLPAKPKFAANTLSFGGMTPLSSSSAARSQGHLRSESSQSNNNQPHSLNASSRSSSFVNMMGSLMHKKKTKE